MSSAAHAYSSCTPACTPALSLVAAATEAFTISAAPSRGPSAPAPTPSAPPALLDRVRQVLRDRHYSPRTEAGTIEWLHRFFAFRPGRAPETLGQSDVQAFLDDLAGTGASPTLRNQARAALVLMFHSVLGQKLNCSDGLGRVTAQGQGPASLSRAEVKAVLAAVEPGCALVASLLYGAGLRLAEACQLRVRDIDLDARVIQVRAPRDRGVEARTVRLPDGLVEPLRQHLAATFARHQDELGKDAGYVSVPEPVRLADPGAVRAWDWQWAFPAARMQRDPVSREGRRPHQHEALVTRALKFAGRAAGLSAPVTAHTLRHCFATHLGEAGVALDIVQALLGVGQGAQLPDPLPASPLDA